jgi:hypothetical protein
MRVNAERLRDLPRLVATVEQEMPGLVENVTVTEALLLERTGLNLATKKADAAARKARVALGAAEQHRLGMLAELTALEAARDEAKARGDHWPVTNGLSVPLSAMASAQVYTNRLAEAVRVAEAPTREKYVALRCMCCVSPTPQTPTQGFSAGRATGWHDERRCRECGDHGNGGTEAAKQRGARCAGAEKGGVSRKDIRPDHRTRSTRLPTRDDHALVE